MALNKSTFAQPIAVTARGRVVYPIAGGSDIATGQQQPNPAPQPEGTPHPAPGTEQSQIPPAQERPRDEQGRFAQGVQEALEADGTNQQGQQQRQLTFEDLERARAEERDKLHTRLSRVDELAQELEQFRQEREERQRREEEEAQAAEQARIQAEREGIDPRFAEELNRVEQEWQQRFDAEREERERQAAIFEQERQLAALEEFRRDVLAQNANEIAPQFHDYIVGNTREEIEASIERAKQKTNEIMTEFQQAQQAQRQGAVGTRPTSPAAGPLEQEGGTRSFSPEEIAAMSPAEYAKYRTQLLPQASAQGLYG